MSDKMRWRYGETNPVIAAVDSSTVIDVGDLLYLSGGKAYPASSLTPESTVAATQAAFSTAFLGVAMQKSVSGDSAPIRVATTGVFEYDAPSATYGLGDKIGIYESAPEAALPAQKVDKVTLVAGAIGRVCRIESTSAAAVLVAIKSVVMNGAYA